MKFTTVGAHPATTDELKSAMGANTLIFRITSYNVCYTKLLRGTIIRDSPINVSSLPPEKKKVT